MDLTTEMVQRFVGGQMNIIQSNDSIGVYCGEIATAVVECNQLRVSFAWFAEGVGGDSAFLPKHWIKRDIHHYVINFSYFSVKEIPPCTKGSKRLRCTSRIIREMVVLIPPDGDILDPEEVEGLELAHA